MTPEEFPPNSKKAKEAAPPAEKPKLEQIVTTGVIRKKSLGSKFKDVFIGGDFRRAAGYVAAEVAIPSLRDLLYNAWCKGAERVIYPESRAQASRPTGLFAPRIQYNSPVRRDPREVPGGYSLTNPPTRPAARQKLDLGDLILGSREEAQMIVEALLEQIDAWDVATIGDLKGLLGHTPTFVDEQWGWTNLASVEIKQVSRGYLVELPNPEAIGS